MANAELYAQAVALAARGYRAMIVADHLTDGTLVYLAECPELSGCLTHGNTYAEAIVMLEDARREYIYSLLQDGKPVPEPSFYEGGTGISGSSVILSHDMTPAN